MYKRQVQDRLGRLDAALQATQRSAEALGLEAESPELKSALALALHLSLIHIS